MYCVYSIKNGNPYQGVTVVDKTYFLSLKQVTLFRPHLAQIFQ